jgi:N-carbamoyl-L-amino-acid hydrolase
MDKNIKVNKERLISRLDELAQIGALEGGEDFPTLFDGVSRLALSDADRQARDLTVSWMRSLSLTIHIDQVGNMIGIRPGEEELPPVLLGSHIDTVTVAGRYDGSYGVMAALEAINVLNDQKVNTRRPLGVAAFTNEEGVRYTPGMLGSTVYVGKLPVAEALATRGFDGSTFSQELDRIGYAGPMKPGAIHPYAFLELHIEQGPLLDQQNIPIGVVETVTGITWLEATVTGTANHAGTTPIDLRRDAGLAAAKLIKSLREIALSIGGNQRATCGMIAFEPNAINVIPGKAILTIDLRNSDGDALIRAEELLHTRAKEIEDSDGVSISVRPLEHVLPVEFDPIVVDAIEQAANELGISSRRMISGAGHDAQLMAGICPTAMIFIPSRNGISHSPAEYSSAEELETGANVLLYAALKLANQKG